MFSTILIYATLTCSQANALINKAQKNESISEPIRNEIVQTIKESASDSCWELKNRDAND